MSNLRDKLGLRVRGVGELGHTSSQVGDSLDNERMKEGGRGGSGRRKDREEGEGEGEGESGQRGGADTHTHTHSWPSGHPLSTHPINSADHTGVLTFTVHKQLSPEKKNTTEAVF